MSRLLQNYIDGCWRDASAMVTLPVLNPSTEEVLGHVPLSPQEDAHEAIIAAQQAFPHWSKTPVPTRTQYLFRLHDELSRQSDELARMIVTEMGKSLPDAEAEVKRALQNIEMACGMPYLMRGEKVPGIAMDIDVETLRLPLGVFTCVTPFNFPLMVPFWFLPYAMATGNTFVLKPSERTPLSMTHITALIDRLDLPPGVFNLVHGDRTVTEAWLNDPRVSGISFVGSTTVARQIAVQCAQQGKRCQALGSAKNYLVVMPDAEMKHTIANMLTSCFGCAGQRCMAASIIACIGEETYARVKADLVAAAQRILVGNPLDCSDTDGSFVMGPVISAQARIRALTAIDQALAEGATLLLDGRSSVPLHPCGFFLGPTILEHVEPGSHLEQTEVFAPVVGLIQFASLDAAIDAINAHPYGNGASIYTQNGAWARHFEIETRCGMIGVNVGVPAPVAYFPFGGSKASHLSDIKVQGARIVDFYTEEKVVTRRFALPRDY